MERLDKIIAGTGKYSRREVKELVRQGRVVVDGRLASSPEEKVDADAACLLVDGQSLDCRRYTYLMLHKPAGVLSARVDGRQQTVLDLLPPELRKRDLSPVGRLDKDTEGLLLLTNHGELTHRLLSPRYHVDKVYYARVEGVLTAADTAAFAGGMVLADGLEDPHNLGAVIRSALLCGAAAFACTLLPVGNLIRLGAAVVVGAGVYAVCIIVSGEGREEVQAVLRRLKR